MKSSGQRLRYLDGLRGVAITAVMLWHFSGPTDAKLLPYGARYADIPILSSGWMGVELFFLISGFVIFMTLERCSGFLDFMLRRWLRLFPAMLIATIVLFAIDRFAGMPGPDGPAQLVDILPGLTFVHSSFWHAVLKLPIHSLSGVFWTLYVECAFYLIFSTAYFCLGWRAAIGCLLALFLLTIGAEGFMPKIHTSAWHRAVEPAEWLGFRYFGWFASGALFYKAGQDGDKRLLWTAILTGLASAALFKGPFGTSVLEHLELGAIVIVFAIAQTARPLQLLLSFRPLWFVGAISYPLYLIHSDIGIALIGKSAPLWAPLPAEISAASAIVAVLSLAWLIQRFAEPWTTARLRPLTDRARQFARLAFA